MRNMVRTLGLALLPPLAVLIGVCLAWTAWQKVPKRVSSWPTQPPLEKVSSVRKKVEMREALARQVLDKEITLFQAAVWFYHLNDEKDGGLREEVYRRKFPGRDDKERACRQVILWVETRLRMLKRPEEEIEAVARALEKELDEHIARHGKVVLEEGR